MAFSNMNGKYFHNVDTKGRVIIPAKIREVLGTEFYITKGFEDECLYLYSEEEWNNFCEKIEELGEMDEDVIEFSRQIHEDTYNCEIDSQGRTLLPAELREYANIIKEVVITGSGKKAIMWDKSTWEAKKQATPSTKDLMKNMRAKGIRF